MTPLVRIHDLCLHLNGRAILHHVDLELPRHGISVLLGRSGSGKTSFLRCLNRFVHHLLPLIPLIFRKCRSAIFHFLDI